MKPVPLGDRLVAFVRRRAALLPLVHFVSSLVSTREREVRAALERLAAEGHSPSTILDSGGGLGRSTLLLREIFPSAHIVALDDRSEAMACFREYCASRGIGGIRFDETPAEELVHSRAFDLILNVDALTRVAADLCLLERLRRSLRAAGVLLLHVPAVPASMPEPFTERDTAGADGRVRSGYKRAGLTSDLREVGFSEVEVRASRGAAGELARWLLVRVPRRVLSTSRLLAPVAAVWAAAAFLPAVALNLLDVRLPKTRGGALVAIARTPASGVARPRRLRGDGRTAVA